LVFHVGSLGDTIISIPALRAIRKYWRGQEITLLHNEIPPHLAGPEDLLAGLGLVDKFLTYPSRGGPLKRITGTGRCLLALRRRRFEAVVYLMRERPAASVQRDRKFFALAGIGTQLGFLMDTDEVPRRGERNELLRVTHESWRVLGRLRELGLDADANGYFEMPLLTPSREVRGSMVDFLRKHRTSPEREIAAICPGTKMPANQWPLDNFVELAHRMTADLGLEVILLGGPADTQAGEQICRAVPWTFDACGKLSIMEVAAVMEHCRALVGLDTGTTHLAAAVGTPVVGLYAARNAPGQWEPLGEGHIVLRAVVPCEGCGVETCPVPGHPCMTGLSVDQVFDSVRRLAGQPAGSRTPRDPAIV
jgi:ADP-heptose:LPS heptosyltransferase